MTQSPASRTAEAERRFLVADRSVLNDIVGTRIEQAYLFISAGWKGRVRRELAQGEHGEEYDVDLTFTLKGPKVGINSTEYRVTLDLEDAISLLQTATYRIEKFRLPLVSEGSVWDVDEFLKDNAGLTIAEFEGSTAAVERLHKPWWCGREVTSDPRFFNENLAIRPWATWTQDERSEATG